MYYKRIIFVDVCNDRSFKQIYLHLPSLTGANISFFYDKVEFLYLYVFLI